MDNVLLGAATARDIEQRIARVLRGLGNPEPPLQLADVRELLRLDRAFYTGNDDGFLRESISRILVASKQVFRRPGLVLDVIKKFDIKAFYVPDRRRILLDQSVPLLKHRWIEGHEVGHSILPWHEYVLFGDNAQTLTPACHAKIEAEANYAAGQLLFLGTRFTAEARDVVPRLESVQRLKRAFGNTITTTLWRFVESSDPDRPLVGIVSVHPHPSRRPDIHNPEQPCRYYIRSPAFAARFATTTNVVLFEHITSYCGAQRSGPLGAADIELFDDRGEPHEFHFETFFNSYEALTLGVYQRPRHQIVGRL